MQRQSDRWTFAAFLIDFINYGITMAAISTATYLPLFLKTNGASNVVIGLIPAAFALGRATGLLAAPQLECRPLIRGWMVTAMVVERLPLLLCGAWILAVSPSRPGLAVAGVLVFWILYTLSNGWASTAWGAFVARSLTVHERGKLSGLGNGISALASLVVVPLVREGIERFGLTCGYGWSVSAAGLLLTSSALIFLLAREEPYPHLKQRLGLAAYLRQLVPLLSQDRRFRGYMGVVSLWLASAAGISYFTVYAMYRFQAGPTAVMGYTIAMALGSGIAGLGGSQSAARGGFSRVFLVGIGLTALSMLSAFAALQSWWIYLAFFLAGAGSTASWMAIINLPLELADRQQVPTYAAVGALMRAPVGALAPLAAGFYLEHFAYQPLFLFCALANLLAAWILVRFVGEPRQSTAVEARLALWTQEKRGDLARDSRQGSG